MKRDKQQWRDAILKSHTVRGVIVLPDDLFSPFASAFTGILILEKGVPHLKTKEMFFARVENDSFRMEKNARLPRSGNQLTTVLDAYFNKKSISRLCGWALLDDKDPLWHPAAPHHVPTSMLTLDEVADGVRELGTARASFVMQHVTALLTLNDDVRRGKITPQSLKDIKKPFQSIAASSTIGALFDIYGGQRELHNKEALLLLLCHVTISELFPNLQAARASWQHAGESSREAPSDGRAIQF